MRARYGFSKMKGRRNPYVKRLKQPVTLRCDARDGPSQCLPDEPMAQFLSLKSPFASDRITVAGG